MCIVESLLTNRILRDVNVLYRALVGIIVWPHLPLTLCSLSHNLYHGIVVMIFCSGLFKYLDELEHMSLLVLKTSSRRMEIIFLESECAFTVAEHPCSSAFLISALEWALSFLHPISHYPTRRRPARPFSLQITALDKAAPHSSG